MDEGFEGITLDTGRLRVHTLCQVQKGSERTHCFVFIKINLGLGVCAGSKEWRKEGTNSTD